MVLYCASTIIYITLVLTIIMLELYCATIQLWKQDARKMVFHNGLKLEMGMFKSPLHKTESKE